LLGQGGECFLQKNIQSGGITSSARPERTEAETGAVIENFIQELVPRLQKLDGKALL
jgi:hypothetical protein